MLRRAAMFLRVTETLGVWDALDQLTDEPRPHETLYAYVIVGKPAMCFVRAAGGRGGAYPMADYRVIEPQPSDADMRTNQAWHKWVMAQVNK
jgi:hypothetical protein